MKAFLSWIPAAVATLLAGFPAAAQEAGPAAQPAAQQLPAVPQQIPAALTAQYALTAAGADTVPVQTIVPVQQQPVQIVESSTYYVAAPQMDRSERRRIQAQNFAARIDSLVRSHCYLFRARTMRELPIGDEHRIYADFYYCAFTADHVELHLPVEQGAARYAEVLNFDSISVSDYRAARLQAGWNISFNIRQNDALYHVDLTVSTLTGEAQLTLRTPHATMRYTGALQG